MVEKKRFLPIKIPLLDSEREILGTSLESLDGKAIKIDLTRSLRGKSIEIIFRINSNKEKADAEPKKLALMGFFIRRMIRKGTNYIEDSFSVDCKNKILRMKPFMITRKKVSRRVRKALRNACKDYIKDYIKNKPAEEIFSDIINNKLQKNLSLKMKKIYPLSLCEIRMLEILEDKKSEEKQKKEEFKKEAEEVKEEVREKAVKEAKEKEGKKEEQKEEKIKKLEEKPEKAKKTRKKKESKQEDKKEETAQH